MVLWLRRDAEETEVGGLGGFSGYRDFAEGWHVLDKRVLCPVALLDKQCFDWRGPLQAVDALTALR